jgi:hypothetical protein
MRQRTTGALSSVARHIPTQGLGGNVPEAAVNDAGGRPVLPTSVRQSLSISGDAVIHR